jgi:hypothetical protein
MREFLLARRRYRIGRINGTRAGRRSTQRVIIMLY